MHRWTLQRGAKLMEDGSAQFSVWGPRVERVSLLLTRDGSASDHPMTRGADGVHDVRIADVPPGSDYLFRLDAERDRPDPVSRCQPMGVHGPSRVIDPAAFRWSDSSWAGLESGDLILYEIHVGTFTRAGTFDAAADRLPYLRELGITAIELMPVAQFPGRRNWGYDGVHPYAPQMSYGGPDGLRRLVDAAHQTGLGVYLDVVYNHLGPEGNYLSEFGPYFTDRYATPWGLAINFDGRDSDQVRRYFIDNALYWITEYHIDGLRLDAVHAIFDFSARHILEEIASAVHAEAKATGRRIQVVAESDLNDPRLVRSLDRGGYGLDATWSDDFHHAIHVTLTGERRGYYMDFGNIEHVAKVYRDKFALDGVYSQYRRRRHGAPATDLPADRFVVFVQNHDQVGNRARGERLSRLVSFEQRKLAAALLLLSPYVPLIFMGEEYGETKPFFYFVDHGDPELNEAVRRGREREFASFDWSSPIAEPGAEATFEASVLEPDRAAQAPHRQLLALYRDLIQQRRSEPALRPGAATIAVEASVEAGWLACRYRTSKRQFLSLFNFSAKPATATLDLDRGRWIRLITTDDERYGGVGSLSPPEIVLAAARLAPIELAGHAATLYAWEPN
jgi:maltooligosyltrehalose trehalohydrolase